MMFASAKWIVVLIMTAVSMTAASDELESMTETCSSVKAEAGSNCLDQARPIAKSSSLASNGPLRLNETNSPQSSDTLGSEPFLFSGAPVEDLLWKAHLWLNQSYEINGEICDKFVVQTSSHPRGDEVESAFLSALEAHAISLTPNGDHFVLSKVEGDKKTSTRSSSCDTSRDSVETHLIRFGLLSSSLAYKWLKPYLSEAGNMRVADHSNSLAVSDVPERMATILLVIQLIDPLAAR